MPAISIYLLLAWLPTVWTSAALPSAAATSTLPSTSTSAALLQPAVATPGPAAGVVPGKTAAPVSSSAPSAAQRMPDHAATLVGGVWQCETIAGNTGTHTYTSEDDGSIDLQTVLHAGRRTFDISETYRFDGAKGLWMAAAGDGAYRGTAAPWTHDKWIFDGIAKTGSVRRPVRMVYFDLGEQAFRRDFQGLEDGTWRTYSAETCTRPSN